MRRSNHLTIASSMFAGLALALAACGGDSTNEVSPINSTPLTQEEANAVASEMRGEITATTNGMSVEGMLNPSFVMPGAMGASEGARAFSLNPIDCPQLSEFPPTDADGDHVPDDLTITYSLDKCTFSNPRRNSSFSISGTIHIVDPSSTDKGIRVEFGSLEHKFTVQDSTFWLRNADGPIQVLASANGFSAIDSTTVHWESSRWPTAELGKKWAVNFTAADSGFNFGRRLPTGDLTVNGSTTRTRGEDVKSFTVETVTPLHYDATCSADDRITSGEVNIVFVRGENTTTVNIVWNGCGQEPTVTITPPPTT